MERSPAPPMPEASGPSVWASLSLTLLGAAGTALGGILVVLRPEMSLKELGMLQSFSAGLMLSLSCMELMPVSIGVLGFGPANFWFFVGVVFFAGVVELIPEPELAAPRSRRSPPRCPAVAADEAAEHLSALSLGPVTRAAPPLLPPSAQGGDEGGTRGPGERGGRGGAEGHGAEPGAGEPALGLRRRAPREAAAAGERRSGALAAPEGIDEGSDADDEGGDELAVRRRVMFSGLVTAVGIALHNFPEGVAVLLASLKSSQVGLSVAIAIALHNVPEGVAVALPVYYATKSRWQGLLYAVAGGLAEPLAVLLFGGVFLPSAFDGVNPEALEAVMACVAGIMAYLALHELLPLALSHVSKQAAVHSLFGGMAIMSLNLYMLEVFTDAIEGV